MRLRVATWYMPTWLKRRKLAELAELTADAFETDPPLLRGLPFKQALEVYAQFTQEQAARLSVVEMSKGDVEEVAQVDKVQVQNRIEKQLYQNALQWGESLRKLLGVTTKEDALAALTLLYSFIEIELICSFDGTCTVSRCFFSDYYEPDTCKLISSLDAGLAAGLLQDQELVFTERITEGKPRCAGSLREIKHEA